ncbi:hypothetical protein BGZ63DRAFT_408905 [Mariannaea sp. PMI_226]|nr:hypothetical protein BGZ63DRAFT_408905 [Mariannaea sp. PMI_226]
MEDLETTWSNTEYLLKSTSIWDLLLFHDWVAGDIFHSFQALLAINCKKRKERSLQAFLSIPSVALAIREYLDIIPKSKTPLEKSHARPRPPRLYETVCFKIRQTGARYARLIKLTEYLVYTQVLLRNNAIVIVKEVIRYSHAEPRMGNKSFGK